MNALGFCGDPTQMALAALFFFGRAELETEATLPPGRWLVKLNSADSKWLGPGTKLTEGHVGESLVSNHVIASLASPLGERRNGENLRR